MIYSSVHRQSKIADQDPQDPQDPHYEYINYFPPYIHKSFMRIIILCTLLECVRNDYHEFIMRPSRKLCQIINFSNKCMHAKSVIAIHSYSILKSCKL